jgi:hypothetical protein
VQTLVRLAFEATTNSGGAKKWRPEYSESLRGKRVAILGDNDEPGRKHVDQVARALHGVAAALRVPSLAGLPEAGDVTDWVGQGHTAEELTALIERTPEWSPSTPPPARIEGQTLGEAWPGRIPQPFGALRLPAGYTATPDGLRLAGGDLITTTPILPIRSVEDVHTEERSYDVLLLEREAARTLRVPALALHDTRAIMALTARGLDASNLTAPAVIKFLTAYLRANRLERIRETHRLGYAPWKGGAAYVLDSLYPEAADIHFADETAQARQLLDGVRPTGDLAGVAEIVTRVATFPAPVTALCAAVAPAVRILLGLDNPGFTLHLVGPSSTGKTIAQRLAMSAWANPFSPAWFHHGHATYASIEASCLRTDGLPVAFEDLRLPNDTQRQDLIYSVGNDSWKGRGGKWATPDRSWRGVLLTSSEYGLVDEDSPGGAGARVLTLPGPTFGEKSETCRRFLDDWLKPELHRHHGLLGRAVLQRLLAITDAERARLIKEWQGRRDVFVTQAAGDSIFARLAPQWALLALTATLIQEVLTLTSPLSLEEAVWEAFTQAQQLPTPDRIQQRYEDVRSWTEANRPFFYVRTALEIKQPHPGRRIYGLINEPDHCVGIFGSELRPELARYGELRPQALLRAWRERGLLKGKGKNLMYPVSIPGRRVWMYVLETPEEPEAPEASP